MGAPSPARPDLTRAAAATAAVVAGVTDADLARPTPCGTYDVATLLAHLDGLAMAFAHTARKDLGEWTDASPADSTPALDDGWRARIPLRLTAMAEAWADPAAWEGESQAGGVTLPAVAQGMFSLDEVVVHGWDLARATGQDYHPDPAAVAACLGLLSQPDLPRDGSLLGAVVETPDDADDVTRLVGLAGRDPAWSPAT